MGNYLNLICMRLIDSITHDPWFYLKPWVLLGTGPSLNHYKYSDAFNIMAIYTAAEVCDHIDILVCGDTIGYYDLWAKERLLFSNDFDHGKCRYIATRAVNAGHENQKTVHWINEADLNFIGNSYPNEYVYPTTTSGAWAIQFLGRAGIKEVYTAGIDGGIGITSNRISLNYQEANEHRKTDFTGEKEELTNYATQYNINLITL